MRERPTTIPGISSRTGPGSESRGRPSRRRDLSVQIEIIGFEESYLVRILPRSFVAKFFPLFLPFTFGSLVEESLSPSFDLCRFCRSMMIDLGIVDFWI